MLAAQQVSCCLSASKPGALCCSSAFLSRHAGGVKWVEKETPCQLKQGQQMLQASLWTHRCVGQVLPWPLLGRCRGHRCSGHRCSCCLAVCGFSRASLGKNCLGKTEDNNNIPKCLLGFRLRRSGANQKYGPPQKNKGPNNVALASRLLRSPG